MSLSTSNFVSAREFLVYLEFVRSSKNTSISRKSRDAQTHKHMVVWLAEEFVVLLCLCVCVFVWSCSCTEILSSSNVDHVELVSCVVWIRRCPFTCEMCTEMVRCPTDLKEMAATVHAGCYWGMQLEQCRSGGVGPVSELLRLQNRGPSIFRTRPRWSIASQRIASAAALKRASSSRWQSCWQCCCQSSRSMLPAEPATTPCDTMQPARSIACPLPSSCSLHWPSCSCCCATINDQVVVHGRGLRLR